jgi:hypothetical protein
MILLILTGKTPPRPDALVGAVCVSLLLDV